MSMPSSQVCDPTLPSLTAFLAVELTPGMDEREASQRLAAGLRSIDIVKYFRVFEILPTDTGEPE